MSWGMSEFRLTKVIGDCFLCDWSCSILHNTKFFKVFNVFFSRSQLPATSPNKESPRTCHFCFARLGCQRELYIHFGGGPIARQIHTILSTSGGRLETAGGECTCSFQAQRCFGWDLFACVSAGIHRHEKIMKHLSPKVTEASKCHGWWQLKVVMIWGLVGQALWFCKTTTSTRAESMTGSNKFLIGLVHTPNTWLPCETSQQL